jgi:hypothetical protein
VITPRCGDAPRCNETRLSCALCICNVTFDLGLEFWELESSKHICPGHGVSRTGQACKSGTAMLFHRSCTVRRCLAGLATCRSILGPSRGRAASDERRRPCCLAPGSMGLEITRHRARAVCPTRQRWTLPPVAGNVTVAPRFQRDDSVASLVELEPAKLASRTTQLRFP